MNIYLIYSEGDSVDGVFRGFTIQETEHVIIPYKLPPLGFSRDDFPSNSALVFCGANALQQLDESWSLISWEGEHFCLRDTKGYAHHCCVLRSDAEIKGSPFYGRNSEEYIKRFVKSIRTPAITHTTEEIDSAISYAYTVKDLRALFDRYTPKDNLVYIDVETDSTDASVAQLLTCSITYAVAEGLKTIAFPVLHPQGVEMLKELPELKPLLYNFLKKNFSTLGGHNVRYDYEVLQRWFVSDGGTFSLSDSALDDIYVKSYLSNPNNVSDGGTFSLSDFALDDTYVKSYLLNPNKGLHKLGLCALRFLGVEKFKESSEVDVSSIITEPLDKVLLYNARDTTLEYILSTVQNKLLKERGLEEVYKFHILRLLPLLLMVRKGAPISGTSVSHVEEELSSEMIKLAGYLHKVTKNPKFNPLSPQQCKKFLLACNVIAPEEGTSKKVLGNTKNTAARSILRFRALAHDLTFARTVAAQCPRVHTTYSSEFVFTGRLSSSNPNLQNVKSGVCRRVFEAPKGSLIVSVDFGQLEARVIASVARDKYFIDAIKNGLDIHAECARELLEYFPSKYREKILGDPVKFKAFRSKVKNKWTFPAFYLASPRSLAGYMGLSESKTYDYYDKFWKRFHGVHRWQNDLKSFYNMHGYISSPVGRKFYGVCSPNTLANWPIQAAAGDLVMVVQVRCYRRGITPILNVHDELVFEVEEDKFPDFLPVIRELFLTHPKNDFGENLFGWLTVPLQVDVKIGKNWGELKHVETMNG